MKRIVWGMMCVCLMLAGSVVAKAQDKEMTGMHHPPKVLIGDARMGEARQEWRDPRKN